MYLERCRHMHFFFVTSRSFTEYENPYMILKVVVPRSNKSYCPHSQISIAYAFIVADELALNHILTIFFY